MNYTLIQDKKLFNSAASARQGRQFWTGPHINDALKHLQSHPNDVCLAPYHDDATHTTKKVLLGGPIPQGTLLDVTDERFSQFSDSFDVGQMSQMTKEWFKQQPGHEEEEVQVKVLENGEMIVVGPNSKLICLARKTPALLDMATTETTETNRPHDVIGQYSKRGTLGHSGDMNSVIGGIQCLHHTANLAPSKSNKAKLFILAGYNNKPLKAWRDSRVFWIVHDPDNAECWLVPHNLSHDAVGDTVSATMPLVAKSNYENDDGTRLTDQRTPSSINVFHLSHPIQASLANASPLNPNNTAHKEFLGRCLTSADSVDWSQSATVSNGVALEGDTVTSETNQWATQQVDASTIDRSIALYDGCSPGSIFDEYPNKTVPEKGTSLSTKHGPLKVLAQGCCAQSRIVVIDAAETAATSEVNSVATQLSGVIFVQTNRPNIYDNLHMVRWNTARGVRTPVLALTPEGCRYLCGPLPPQIQVEDYPTPVAGTPIPTETVQELIQFALSPESDDYFGALYQPVPNFGDVRTAIRGWQDEMAKKDFRAVLSDNHADLVENGFDDEDFRRLMEAINMLSVSNASALERNSLAISVAKFLRAQIKKVSGRELDDSVPLQKYAANLALLKEWSGDNMEWAVSTKDSLEDLLKEFSIKIEPEEGLLDLALQTKLDAAIQKKKVSLLQTIQKHKKDSPNKIKKIFNAVFGPALEALMSSIGESNPRYFNFLREIVNANLSGVIICATQSSNKQSAIKSPEEIMGLFHKIGAKAFISFTVNFLQTWKAKVINQICVVDEPGKGFNDPKSFAPVDHRIENGPEDPSSAYETDIRHQFVLPVFSRLPKSMGIGDDEDSDEDIEDPKQMPVPLADEDLAEYLLMRAEFTLRDPEQGTKHPMWAYADWLFNQIKTIHQVNEKQAAPLVVRALGYSILQIMNSKPEPGKNTMETVASIIHAINFISARGNPQPHAAIDCFFNMGSNYVPMSKDLEKDPWQIEVVNILSRAVDYVRPLMSAKEYAQIRSNFQRGCANVVKRQIVQKLLDHMQAELKKNEEAHEDYVARVNSEFYPAYREVVETIGMLLEADPQTFELTEELCKRIDSLHHTIVTEWAPSMRRCRIGPVKELVSALKSFRNNGPEAMAYLISRKPYLSQLYDQVFHIKYEACDHVLVEEVCKIIRAKGRNPEHANHPMWLNRVETAIQDVSSYDTMMSGYAHGNNYKRLPSDLMLTILRALKEHPGSNGSVTFAQVKELLSHVNIRVEDMGDLRVGKDNPDGKQAVFDQLRGAWWMCPGKEHKAGTSPQTGNETVPEVAMIPVGAPASSNVLAILGDTYHKFELARFYSGDLSAMRSFIRENYKFHVEWFEDTIRAAGFPKHFDRTLAEQNNIMAIYAVAQRLVHELVQDGADRGDRARDRVYGEVFDPLLSTTAIADGDGRSGESAASNVGLLKAEPDVSLTNTV